MNLDFFWIKGNAHELHQVERSDKWRKESKKHHRLCAQNLNSLQNLFICKIVQQNKLQKSAQQSTFLNPLAVQNVPNIAFTVNQNSLKMSIWQGFALNKKEQDYIGNTLHL